MATGPAGQKIVLFGNFGTGNFGNEATLRAILHNLRKRVPEAEFSCVCSGPENTALAHHILALPTRASFRKMLSALRKDNFAKERSRAEAVPPIRNRWFSHIARLKGPLFEPYRWLEGLRTLRGKDALVVPGTGLLTDAYGLFDWGPYEMFRWSVTARLCRCRLLFVSVGAGPLHSRAGRFFVKRALSLADFRSYRDESTPQYLRAIGFHTGIDRVSPDLAFSLPDRPIRRTQNTEGQRQVVGIGLMGYAGKYSVEKPTTDIYARYLETLSAFVKWLLAHDYSVRLLIGDLGDTPVTREFRSLLKARSAPHEEDRIIDEPIASVEDLLSQLATTDLVVATRFHNVLLSLLLNKPVIAVSFHHKCSSLMNQMGMSEYCQDINDLQVEKLIERFNQLQQKANSVSRMIREKVQNCQIALDEQYGTILAYMHPDAARVIVPAAHSAGGM